jgi:hypothetical protein
MIKGTGNVWRASLIERGLMSNVSAGYRNYQLKLQHNHERADWWVNIDLNVNKLQLSVLSLTICCEETDLSACQSLSYLDLIS